MTAAEREELRQRVSRARRLQTADDSRARPGFNNYDHIPGADKVRAMVRWVDCPVHGLKVGLDKDGHVLGRCSSCAQEAAAAQALIEAGLVA